MSPTRLSVAHQLGCLLSWLVYQPNILQPAPLQCSYFSCPPTLGPPTCTSVQVTYDGKYVSKVPTHRGIGTFVQDQEGGAEGLPEEAVDLGATAR